MNSQGVKIEAVKIVEPCFLEIDVHGKRHFPGFVGLICKSK